MDEQWIEHLMLEYSAALLKYLMHHTSSREDAEDILQEVFLSCHRHAAEFDPSRCNEQAWLYIIAKRKLISYYKAINVMACRQAVAKALSILDERSRSVVVLRCLKGLSPDETAKRLALTPGNVRVIQSRALGKMSKFLEDSDFSPEDFFS